MWIYRRDHPKFGEIDEGPFGSQQKAETERLAAEARGEKTTGPFEVAGRYRINKGYFLGEVISLFED